MHNDASFSKSGPTLEDYAIVVTDSDGEGGSETKGESGYIEISSLIVEIPKSERNMVEALQVRKQNKATNFVEKNQGYLQRKLKYWFYDSSSSVSQNIGMTLRQLYLVTDKKEEELESKQWELYASDENGIDHLILSKRTASQFIKNNCVLILKKRSTAQMTQKK